MEEHRDQAPVGLFYSWASLAVENQVSSLKEPAQKQQFENHFLYT